jgi:hypothetical protein
MHSKTEYTVFNLLPKRLAALLRASAQFLFVDLR